MNSIINYFEERVKKYSDNPLIWEKEEALYNSFSYKEVNNAVQNFAAGLIGLGVQKGDRIALLSEGRKDWLIAELAILHTNAINVPLSVKLEESSDLVFRIQHSDSKLVIVSEFQLNKIRNIKDELPLLEKVIILDSINDIEKDELTWAEVYSSGEKLLSL